MNARQMARTLGSRGGRKRALVLSGVERRRIASLGGKARSTSLQAARRIAANLEYAALVQDLSGKSTHVARLRAFEGPLPGIYRTGR
jgi:hypothetical protein